MPTSSDYSDMLNFAKSVEIEKPEEPIQKKTSKQDQYQDMLKFSKSIENTREQPIEQMQEPEPEQASEAGRLGMRGLEALLGMPGEIYQSMAQPMGEYVSGGLKALTGKGLTQQQLEEANTNPLLPSSEKIREFQKGIFGERFEPTSEGERKRDEIVQDVVRVGGPLIATGGHGLLTNIGRIAGIVGAGQTGKSIAKAFGYGEEGQEYAKIGSQLLASIVNPRLGKNIYQYHYGEANKLPETVTGDATKLRDELRNVSKWANSHTDTAAKEFVRAQIGSTLRDLESQGATPKFGYQAARELNTSINQNSQGLYELPRDVRNIARRRVDNIRGHIGEFMRQSEQTHPEFYNHWRTGNEVYGALAGSRQFGDFVRRRASTLAKAGISHHLLATLASGIEGIPATAIQQGAVGGTIAGGYQAYKLMYKIMRSPTLLRAYTQAVAEGAAGNMAATANALRKIDRAIGKEDEED